MAITRWDPMSDMMSLRQVMDRLFEDAWVPSWGAVRGAVDSGFGTLPVDVYETDDAVVVTASLPGLKPEDIDNTVQGDMIRIHGETKHDEEVKDDQFHRVERSYGSFTRSFALPHTVDAGKVEASYKDGVLTITLPQREEAKPKQIKVNVAA